MSEDTPFLDLIRLVRAGDEQACTELVRRYEPAIRIAVHVRLNDPQLRRLFDSMDICQSVLGNFFVRAALGQFDLAEPGQLLGLLVTMARNRLTHHALRQQAARRDCRKTRQSSADVEAVDPGPSPSDIVAGAELLQELRKRLSPEERHLAEQRAAARTWEDIAIELGDTPDAVRVRLNRAIDRVSHALNLDE